MVKNTFEPKIIAFCCHYCAFAAADLAGTMRLQYPPNIRIIRTPCTGRLETEYFMRAFEKGADGVLVAGCLEGGCHFIDGNLYARRRVDSIKKILKESGLEPERLRMVNLSASMAKQLVDFMTDMVNTIKELGPSPLKNTKKQIKSEITK
jgi:F420-non-reducing hydrogenase iron-sulfur subunit